MVTHLSLGFDSKLWEGSTAIFREKWIISHVRVHTIRTRERGLLAKLDVIPIRGLYGEEGPATSIGSIWEHLFIDEHIWLGRGYCGWRLFFEPELIQQVLSIASSFPPEASFEAYDTYYDVLVQPLNKVETPLCNQLRASDIDPPREPDVQLADDFARTWVRIEEFFGQALSPSAWKDYLLAFVSQLRRGGYDRKLRAGKSSFAFTVSRSRRHGLRPDQPWISFLFHDSVMDMMICEYHKRWACTLGPLVSPGVTAALRHLLKHPID
jgi:hypothetical protein